MTRGGGRSAPEADGGSAPADESRAAAARHRAPRQRPPPRDTSANKIATRARTTARAASAEQPRQNMHRTLRRHTPVPVNLLRMPSGAEALHHQVEHRRVNRPFEPQTGGLAGDPADFRFENLEPVELDQHMLPIVGPLDQLDLAALRREIEHADSEIGVAEAAHAGIGGKRDAVAPAVDVPLRRLLGFGVEVESSLAASAPADVGIDRAPAK